MSRKLASIRKITEINPIDNADNIESAVVDGGWNVVVKKGEFKEFDFAVYFEIDSWIPNSLAPFLTRDGKEPKEYNGVKGERLRTVKLRKTLSQGLLLPISILDNYDYQLEDGYDLTEILDIKKYEPPIPFCLAGICKGSFPSSFPKTDEERVQNLAKGWTYYNHIMYEVSEKLEGSSMSCGLLDNEFIVCSRNINLKESDTNSFWIQARRYDIENKLRAFGYNNLIIQGELIGPGIQGNYYELSAHDFYTFAIYDIQLGRYISPLNRKRIVKELDLNHVPIINENFIPYGMSIQEVLEMADGKSDLKPSKLREGLVFKSISGESHWKAVSNQYLLKHKD